MLFNSYIFIFCFLPLTILGFFLIGKQKKHRMAIAWLVLTSLFFYGWWNPVYLILLGFSILFNYWFGCILNQEAGRGSIPGKGLLTIGVSINLCLLGYFKYAMFFVGSLNAVAGTDIHIGTIFLPLAISFFTFQQMAYLVDAYRGEAKEYDFLHYCLFVCFFPQLIAGPIVHHKEMIPQFMEKRIFTPKAIHIAVGMTIFFVGLFKKVVIADNMALHATPVFTLADNGASLTFFQAWEGSLAYTFQLYFDFSGYSDMAIGIARMFGIILPENFNSPYKAKNSIDFWKRWHITLSRFLRDYLYFPLGGNRKGKTRRYMNLIITMLLGGLWHGAGWTYVVWGALHGFYLLINHLWRNFFPRKKERVWSSFLSRLVTFLAVVIAWVFFRAETFHGALNVLKGMVNLPNKLNGKLGPMQDLLETVGIGFNGGLLKVEHYNLFAWLVFWLFVIWVWPNTQEWLRKYEPVLEAVNQGETFGKSHHIWPAWHPTARWAAFLAFIAVLGVLGLSSVTEFLYFQF